MQQTSAISKKKSLPALKTKANDDKPAVFLHSEHDFFEIFALKPQISGEILIPSTLLFEESRKTLLFNEVSSKTLKIKAEKLENPAFFARILKERAIAAKNPKKKLAIQLFEALKRSTAFRAVALIKQKNTKKTAVSAGELEEFLRNRGDSISFAQEFVHLPLKNDAHAFETFYCEMQQTAQGKSFVFKKKTRKFADFHANFASSRYIPAKYHELKQKSVAELLNFNRHLAGFQLYCAILQSFCDVQRDFLEKLAPKPLKNAKISTNLYNCFDQQANSLMIHACNVLSRYFTTESAELRSLKAKFLYNSSKSQLFFIGIKELSVNFREKISRNISSFAELKDLSVKELRSFLEIPAKPRETPHKPAQSLRKPACCGDFCDYCFENYEKGGVEELQRDSSRGFQAISRLFQGNPHENPHEISSIIIEKVRNCAKTLDFASICRKFGISPRNRGETPGNSEIFKENRVFFHRNEYKLVKVCTNCFLMYGVLSKELETLEKLKEKAGNSKQNATIHSELAKKLSAKQQLSQVLRGNPWKTPIFARFPRLSSKTLRFTLGVQASMGQSRISLENSEDLLGNREETREIAYNLFRNTRITHKGEVPFDAEFCDAMRMLGETPRDLLNSPTRSSLFGNPQRKSTIYSPETFKFHVTGGKIASPRATTSPSFKKSFSSYDAQFLFQQASATEKPKEKHVGSLRKSTFIAKKLANLPVHQKHRLLQRKLTHNSSLTRSFFATSLFHRSFEHLRKLPWFRLSTPKLSVLDGKKGLETEETPRKINAKGVAWLSRVNLRETLDFFPEILVVDEVTAIPFTVIFSESAKEVKKKEVLIVCPDFFENFLRKVRFFKDLLRNLENFVVVLLNFPGQFLSLFSEDRLYTNEYLSRMLDFLLFELGKRKVFHLKSDNLRFIGFGFGCNVILHLLFSLDSAVISVKSCLFFNAFLFVDEKLAAFIAQSLFLAKSCAGNGGNAYSGGFFEANAKVRLNLQAEKSYAEKISPQARACILKGCEKSVNLSETLRKMDKLWLFFVQSSHNSLFSREQRAFIERNTTEIRDLKDFRAKGWKNPEKFRISVENTGYDIFNDNPEAVSEILRDFLVIEFPWEINQRIAFIDKLLLIIEENLRNFFQEDVENYNNSVEIAENLQEFVGNLPIEAEDCAEILNGYAEIQRKIAELREKIDKAFTVFRENFAEIQQIHHKDDDLISKIMNIQQKKLNEFSKYMASIQKEIEIPLKTQVSALKLVGKYVKLERKFRSLQENSLFSRVSREFVDKSAELLNEIRSFFEFVGKFLDFSKKCQENLNLEEKPKENIAKNLQEIALFIRARTGDFLEIFQEIYAKVKENPQAFVDKAPEISWTDLLNCCEIREKSQTLDNEIDLLGSKRRENQENETKARVLQLRAIIERISTVSAQNQAKTE